MQIKFECYRCNKIVAAKLYKAKFKKGTGHHNRLDCTECGKFIKFIGSDELDEISPGWEEMIDFKNKKKISDDRSILAEISFKLDLIIDHLGIKA